MRHLNLILGDQLDLQSSIFESFDPQRDSLWMAEVHGENSHVRHHKHQIIMFLSAMRHFAEEQSRLNRPILYTELSPDASQDRGTELGDVLKIDIALHQPDRVRVVRPGDRRVLRQIESVCQERHTPLELLEDSHFFTTPEDFRRHAQGRKTLRLEYFYRELRARFRLLMDDDAKPLGGQWNFDAENRESFGKSGPGGEVPVPLSFEADDIVREVQALTEQRYLAHPGHAGNFALPVTRVQSLQLLDNFIEKRLKNFGDHQDAMWEGEFFLYHSRLSSALNIKLLRPEEVCRKAEEAYHKGSAPLNAVEGFIRQILGWREYIRGVYWHFGENYREKNYLEQSRDLPEFYWTGKTSMNCLSQTLASVHQHAYSHHIQRLMVTGLFCLLYGVEPEQFNDWHLATHCDAVDWVSTPNVLGMSQFSDGGMLASKPYCASGNYIHKMSNYCANCRYHPKKALGAQACPFTTLYWDFLNRHRHRLESNPRLKFQFNNLKKKSGHELEQISQKAESLISQIAQGKEPYPTSTNQPL